MEFCGLISSYEAVHVIGDLLNAVEDNFIIILVVVVRFEDFIAFLSPAKYQSLILLLMIVPVRAVFRSTH
jgi:hypothetical protein